MGWRAARHFEVNGSGQTIVPKAHKQIPQMSSLLFAQIGHNQGSKLYRDTPPQKKKNKNIGASPHNSETTYSQTRPNPAKRSLDWDNRFLCSRFRMAKSKLLAGPAVLLPLEASLGPAKTSRPRRFFLAAKNSLGETCQNESLLLVERQQS